MPRFMIEREIPGAGSWSPEELRAGSQKSNEALSSLAPQVQWQHSYVTGDKVFCVFIAEDEEVVREHARRSGFPVDAINLVASMIDPTTGEVSEDRCGQLRRADLGPRTPADDFAEQPRNPK